MPRRVAHGKLGSLVGREYGRAGGVVVGGAALRRVVGKVDLRLLERLQQALLLDDRRLAHHLLVPRELLLLLLVLLPHHLLLLLPLQVVHVGGHVARRPKVKVLRSAAVVEVVALLGLGGVLLLDLVGELLRLGEQRLELVVRLRHGRGRRQGGAGGKEGATRSGRRRSVI